MSTPILDLVPDLTKMRPVSLRELDIQLDGTTPLPEVEEFCQALDHIKNVRHVTIRKPSSVYLTQPGVMLAMKHLAQGFERWSDLVRVLLNFRHCRMVFLTSSDTMLVFC